MRKLSSDKIPLIKAYKDIEKEDINISDLIDADLIVQVKGFNDFYDLAFVKKVAKLEDDDIVAVIEHKDFTNLVGQVVKNTNIVLRRVIKIGDNIQLRDIHNLFNHIDLKEDNNIEILGKVTYKLCYVS